MDPAFTPLYSQAAPYTMTSVERMYALYQAVRYVTARPVAGAIVECGVWRGGSSLLAALTLTQLDPAQWRDVYLFDTFAGWPAPTDLDVDHTGQAAAAGFTQASGEGGAERPGAPSNLEDVPSLEEVQQVMALVDYPHVSFIAGRVEDTVPARAPERIAVLRLDTDWYASTRHELEHLYPRVSEGGVVIVDDYGHWRGARQAVDEYFAASPVLLARIDYTGRMIIKTGSP